MSVKNTDFSILIMTAGKGIRMRSNLPKSLQILAGMPIIAHILQTVQKLNPSRIGVVVGEKNGLLEKTIRENIKKWSLKSKIEFMVQKKADGTATAVKCAGKFLKKHKKVLILCGDTPMFEPTTLLNFKKDFIKHKVLCSVLTSHTDNPHGYGRIVRDMRKNVKKIVEEGEANTETKKIKEVNSGVYIFDTKALLSTLDKIKMNPKKHEYYLTDAIELLHTKGKIKTFIMGDFKQAMGINSKKHLAQAEKILRQKTLEKLMDSGVVIIDPENTYIDGKTKIGRDTIIQPNVYIENSTIGKNCVVKMGSYIVDSKIGNGVQIGPYAHLRPESDIGDNAKIGNFSEIKKSKIGTGSKVPHLSYVGDSVIGKKVNIGAGTITCNYDGKNKHKTIIGDNVFVGSNVNFIAPVKIGSGVKIGAGSTITEDVSKNKLVIARARQIEKKSKK